MSWPPLVHRSWLARGAFSPSPTWGDVTHAIMLESTVAFTRTGLVRDGSGGFMPSPTEAYLTVQAHVEFLESANAYMNETVGPARQRVFMVYMDMPADLTDVPKKGDRIAFTDATNVARDIPITKVTNPQGLGEYLVIETEEVV